MSALTAEHVYFADGFESIEDIRATHGTITDATYLSKIPSCPRSHQIAREERLRSAGQLSAKMVAGIAVHEGLDWYYSIPEPDRTASHERWAIQIIQDTWASFELDRALMDPKEIHLSAEHLSEVTQNYFDYWLRGAIEIYSPISGLYVSDLNLDNVLAAKFKTNSDDHIILGESSFIMLFELDGEPLVLAGKPDLPVVKQDGRTYALDHKTTSSYLSDWWAQSHEVSNKLRGYMAMLRSLLGREMHGAVINALYVGKHATNPKSTATKFQRFQFDFTPGHVEEALRNQLAWKKTIDFYRDLGYFPQGCGFGGCDHPKLCKAEPAVRDVVKERDYVEDDRDFWSL